MKPKSINCIQNKIAPPCCLVPTSILEVFFFENYLNDVHYVYIIPNYLKPY